MNEQKSIIKRIKNLRIMKEISVEEKAKAYNESRERMKDFLKEWENCGALGEAMEKAKAVFPELKEWFEDERIRKSLTAYFAKFKQSDMWDDDFSFGDILAWLEKQGENHIVENNEMVKAAWSEEDKKMSRFIGIAITDYDDASMYLESKGIQVIDAHVWLDGLKDRVQPQNTWKPSDEQIKVLVCCMSPWFDSKSKAILESLINDLKKLKGEE